MIPVLEKRIRPAAIFIGIIIWVTILSAFTGFADTGTKNERQIAPLLDAGTKKFIGKISDHPNYSPKKIDQKAWKSIESEFTFKEMYQAKDGWLRIESLPLDIENIERPTLYISAYLNGLYVYLNGRRIYRYGTLSGDGSKVPPKTRINHFIAIDTDNFSSDDPPVIHIAFSLINLVDISWSTIQIGSAQSIRQYAVKAVQDEIRKEIPYIILGGFLFISGVASVALFFNHLPNREYPFLSFGLFLLCAGGEHLFSEELCAIFYISPRAANYRELFDYMLPVGLLAFVNQIYDSKFPWIVRCMLFFHLLLIGVVVINTGVAAINHSHRKRRGIRGRF